MYRSFHRTEKKKSELSQFFLRCCFYHPLFTFIKRKKKYITPYTADVWVGRAMKKKITQNTKTTSDWKMFDGFWRLFNVQTFYGCCIYSHVFYDLSYLHITHHDHIVHPKHEDYFIFYFFGFIIITLCHKLFHSHRIHGKIINTFEPKHHQNLSTFQHGLRYFAVFCSNSFFDFFFFSV